MAVQSTNKVVISIDDNSSIAGSLVEHKYYEDTNSSNKVLDVAIEIKNKNADIDLFNNLVNKKLSITNIDMYLNPGDNEHPSISIPFIDHNGGNTANTVSILSATEDSNANSILLNIQITAPSRSALEYTISPDSWKSLVSQSIINNISRIPIVDEI